MFKFKFCPECGNKIDDIEIDGQAVQQCAHCQYINWRNPKPVVSIVISNAKNEVLLLRRASNPFKDYWVLPGGFVTLGETPKEAIAREVKEEIGQEPTVGKVVGAYLIDTDPRGMHIDIIYSGKLENDDIQLSAEHSEYKYFALDNLPENIAYKHRQAIKDFLKNDNWKTAADFTRIKKSGVIIDDILPRL